MIPTPLIDATALRPLLGKAVFLDVRAGPGAEAEFEAGHVRGAVRVDLERDLSTPRDPSDGGRHPLPTLDQWCARLGRWGIAPAIPVVLYDASSGAMAAARAWWMLRAVGHRSLSVVDGGWAAIRDAGIPIDSVRTSVASCAAYPACISSWPSVDANFVERISHDSQWRLLDARAPARFEGREEPLDPVAGHIPGAENLPWKTLLDARGRFLSSDELRVRFGLAEPSAEDERIVCYCGSGVTACQLLLAMEASGIGGGELYVGSWSEWCRTH